MNRYCLMLVLIGFAPAWAQAVSPGTGVAERVQRQEERRRERLDKERVRQQGANMRRLESGRAEERARQEADWRRAVEESRERHGR